MKSIGSMLLSGKLDAALHYIAANNLVDRSKVNLDERADGHYLFPDRAAEGRRYFAKTGLYPINHGMVVRRSIVEKHPWVVLNIYRAFLEAKNKLARWGFRGRRGASRDRHPRAGSGRGVEARSLSLRRRRQSHVLETIARYSNEQGLTPRVLSLEEIFPPATLSL